MKRRLAFAILLFSAGWTVPLGQGFGQEPIRDPAGGPAAGAKPGRYNVLFLVVDDLRPMLGCYGQSDVHSPNIDKFAASGLVFERAYCQQAVCNPSRCSVLSGCRPDTTGVMVNKVFLRPQMPDVVTLPQHFKNHGYHVLSLGKIFHHSDREPGDDPLSWSEPSWYHGESTRSWFAAESLDFITRLKALPAAQRPRLLRGPPFEAADEPDAAYGDGQLAAKAVETLGRLGNRPFFLGVGFHKPHLPFNCPRKYWDLYPAESSHSRYHRTHPHWPTLAGPTLFSKGTIRWSSTLRRRRIPTSASNWRIPGHSTASALGRVPVRC